jgi:death-on-curing protein
MVEITVEEIVELHNLVIERFKITRGIINQGSLESIVKRPELQINGKYVYNDVFSKAASILEGIIRWHPFADGNKRTALLATIYYLKLEGYGVAVPLSAVRYTVTIAKNDKSDEESTKKLIKQISNWLRVHSGSNKLDLWGSVLIHVVIPYRFLGFLFRLGFKKYVAKKVGYWMAFDIYPEYVKEADYIIDFIDETLEASFNVFKE